MTSASGPPAGDGRTTGAAMGMVVEFRDFLVNHNVLALAVGVVIGASVGKVVTGIVDDLIMPVVGVMIPGGEWHTAELVLSGKNAIKYGDLLGRLIDFAIVATVVFLILKAFIRKVKPPATKACPQCLETIPLAATRCRACTSSV
jgi:large conductance mechanosensitive channel